MIVNNSFNHSEVIYVYANYDFLENCSIYINIY